jgi:hypothetical protein
MRKTLAFAFAGLAMSACNANLLGPQEADLLKKPAVQYTGTLANPWFLYQEGFNFNLWFQGLAVWDNYHWVSVDPASSVSPKSGSRCLHIRYDNSSGGSPTWAELAFIHTPDWSGFASTPGNNIGIGGYTVCRFWIRTSVPATVPVQMDGVGATNIPATPTWSEVSVSLPPPALQTAVKTVFQVNTPSVLPLDIYIDDLRYEQ